MGLYGNKAKEICNKIMSLKEDCIGTGNGMTIYTYQQDTRKLEGDPDNAYMEVYNNEDKMKATKMIRLVIGKPYYRNHKGQKPLWDINKGEIKDLNKLLNSQSTSRKYKGLTVFQAALKFYKLDLNTPVTDYTNMIPDPGKSQKNKDTKKK